MRRNPLARPRACGGECATGSADGRARPTCDGDIDLRPCHPRAAERSDFQHDRGLYRARHRPNRVLNQPLPAGGRRNRTRASPIFVCHRTIWAADMVDKALGAAHAFRDSANPEWITFRARLKDFASSLRRDFAIAAQRQDHNALARMALILAKLGKVRPARRLLRALRFKHEPDAARARFILRRRTAGLASAVRHLSRNCFARRDVELRAAGRGLRPGGAE